MNAIFVIGIEVYEIIIIILVALLTEKILNISHIIKYKDDDVPF